jgi:hypothetical protein
VHDSGVVQHLNGVRGLTCQPNGGFRRQPADPVGAFDVVHDELRPVGVAAVGRRIYAHVMDPDHPRALDPAKHPCPRREPFADVGVDRPAVGQHLDGDHRIELRMVLLPHGGEGSGAEHIVQPVPPIFRITCHYAVETRTAGTMEDDAQLDELVRAAQAGDGRALDEVLSRIRPLVLRRCARFLAAPRGCRRGRT